MVIVKNVGEPIYAIGSVTSVFTNSKFQIANLILTLVDNGQYKMDTRLAVTYILQSREKNKLKVGMQVGLTGVITEETQTKSKPKSWLLGFLQPSYQFRGKINIIGNLHLNTNWNLRSKLQQIVVDKMNDNSKLKAQEGLIESIVFGGNVVTKQMHQIFLRAGVLHILAASGANMLFMERLVAPVLSLVFRKLPFGRWLIFVGLLGFIWLYAALCGGEASIIRAAWMSSYRTIGKMAGRTPSTGASLWFAALCMSISNPSQLWSISSILSYIATYAVDYAINGKYQFWKKTQKGIGKTRFSRLNLTIWSNVKGILWTSVSVELFTAPLIEVLFGQWTPYAIFSNLLIEPILVLLLPFSALWFVFAFISVSHPVINPIYDLWTVCMLFMVQVLEKVLTWIASLPGSLVTLPVFPPVWFIGYYTCLILLLSIRPFARTFTDAPKSKLGWSSKRL